jgi:beta-aspartyl-peptidase (threonine type)
LRELSAPQADCLAQALVDGYGELRSGGAAIDAVEAAVRVLEASGLFNAGLGSNRQLDGVQRMDASLMEGRDLRAGAVASIEGVLHPIAAARRVMEDTAHVLIVGEEAAKFAKHMGLAAQTRRGPRRIGPSQQRPLSPPAKKTWQLYREMQQSGQLRWAALGKETVGAVALDRSGTVAAGASTGGVDIMLPGRVGDSPLIGCGVYADNQSGAVSMTGLGECIIRIAVAKEICDRLETGASPAAAARAVLQKLVSRVRGAAGVLVLTPDGGFAIRHTTPRMAAGYWNGKGKPVVSDRFK